MTVFSKLCLVYFTHFVLGFAARELCTRIEHCEPKVIIAASCGIEPNKIVKYVYMHPSDFEMILDTELNAIYMQSLLLQHIQM